MDKTHPRHALRITCGITMLALLLAGGASSAFTEVQLTTSTSDDQHFVIPLKEHYETDNLNS